MNELEWLNDQRPEVAVPDDETTGYARAALLAYAVRGGEERRNGVGTPRAQAGARRPRARGRAGLYAVAAAVFAIAMVVVAGALPSGDDGPARQFATKIGAPTAAEAAPLVKLSKRIAAQATPTGDATLVLRSQEVPGEGTVTGADLYLDDGHYYYAKTLDQLRGSGTSKDVGDDVINREVLAAKAAVGLAPDEARKGVVAAILGDTKMRPGVKSTRELDDNHIWGACVDAMSAGAGNKDVRAGVMALLATIPTVKVEDHGATLALRDTTNFEAVPGKPFGGGGYEETMIVDAKTGVLQKLAGGEPGKTPQVLITYDIKRVTGEDILG